MTQGILILIAVILGWTLRGYRIGQIREVKQQLKKKLLKDKSGVVDWTPPKSGEEQAEEEIKKNLEK